MELCRQSGPVAELGGLLSDADSLAAQIVAWLLVLLAFELFCCVLGFVVGEIRLRRLYDRPPRRWGRAGTAPTAIGPPTLAPPVPRYLRPPTHRPPV